MQSLEAACDEGERAVKRLKALQTAALPLASPKEESQTSSCDSDEKRSRFDIFDRLQKLHEEDETENSCDEDETGVQYKSLILDRLVETERLNTIILNLYPGNKGYSLAFRIQDRSTMCDEELIETTARCYEEDTILRYVDNEEIPPFILDALDRFSFLFYSGCVIVEVRNHRQAHPEVKYYNHHVLLRPTQKTILAEINTLTRDRPDFSHDDRDALESQMLIAQNPDLCLDPDPHLENSMSAIQSRSRLWNEHPFRKMARMASQVAVNRKRKLNHFARRHGLELLDFCKAKRSRTTTAAKSAKAAPPEETKTVIPIPNLEDPMLAPPTTPVVIEKFKAMAWPEETSNCTPQLMEEYTLETDITSKDKDKPRVYHIKLSIFQRPANLEYLGELYLDRDYKKDQRNGVACTFSLGSCPNAHRYVRQFTEIFTESGRKAARISCGLATAARQDAQASSQQQPPAPPNPRDHLERLNQVLQAQTQQPQPVLNGIVQGVHPVQFQQARVQEQKAQQKSSPEREIDALATKFEVSYEHFRAAEKAKRQQVAAAQQQKLLSNNNIISLLNSLPASSINSDASAAVANAINSAGGMASQRLLPKKMTLSNVTATGARVLSHGNLIALNNHNRLNLHELNAQLNNANTQTVTLTANNAGRVNLSDLNAQTVRLTSVSGSGGSYSYTAVPVKPQLVHHQRIVSSSPHQEGGSETALGALLVGTPAANRPEIASPNQASSLLLEKLAASSGQNPFAQSPKTPQATTQFLVQSPKANTVISPMSSPPPQTSNTVNVQSLNLSQLQNIPGLHNVQFQLQNFAQPISLAVNVGGQITGGAASQGLLMSLAGTQAQHATQVSGAQQVQGVVVNAGGSNAGASQLAHLVTSGGIKNLTHHNLRTATSGSQTLQLAPGSSPQFQLISQRTRQQNLPAQASITSRTLQRTPITIKVAPNSNQPGLEAVQHYQQLCISQPKTLEGVFDKLRRSSND